jgi:hypothetical protein
VSTRRLLILLPAMVLPCLATGPAHAGAAWQWPLPPPHQVVRGFAPPAHDWLPGRRGVDLAAHTGERVHAAGAGRVGFAGTVAGIGVVTIRHADGLETTYEPVRPTVHAGAVVTAGAVIGAVVAHGGHCLPAICLHWGVRRGDAYLDPVSLVGAERVRLLPVLSQRGAGSWLAPAAGGATVGSSAAVAGWALAVSRRRRRPLPPGVASLAQARAERELLSECCSKCSR